MSMHRRRLLMRTPRMSRHNGRLQLRDCASICVLRC
jgi:hypothetical protein